MNKEELDKLKKKALEQLKSGELLFGPDGPSLRCSKAS